MFKPRTDRRQARLAWGGLGLCATGIIAACSASSGGGSDTPLGAGLGGLGQSGANANAGVPVGGTPGAGGGFVFGTGSSSSTFDASKFNTGGAPGAGGVSFSSGGGGPLPPPPPPQDQPVLIDDCTTSGLDPALVQQLQGGGSPGGQMLYPYDGTVFPVGLIPPTLQWSGNPADAVYLHMKSTKFEYKGCFGPNQALRLGVPVNAWQTAGVQSQGATDPLTIELSTSSGGTVSGPIVQKQYFALGRLKGDVYYNTYTSPLAQQLSGAPNGAVLRLHLGDPQPQVLVTDRGVSPSGPCWSCHSLSARGSVIVLQHHEYPNIGYFSAAIDLAANPNPQPACGGGNAIAGVTQPCTTSTLIQSSVAEMGLGAVYPDGSKVLTMGSPGDSTVNFLFPDGTGNVPGMVGPKPSMLVSLPAGTATQPNWNVQFAKMPSFSPDGSMVVFNWHEDSGGHTLAVADFDNASSTFSNVRIIYKDANLYPGWPWITPDNKEVIFVLGNTQDFVSSYPFPPLGRPAMASSDLWTVDIATGQASARPMARANGYTSPGGPTYLPKPGRDEHLEFFPTMSPIQAGGYFWVFFTSRRTYGNSITQVADDAVTKKIWVSAYNIRTGGVITDPSNPPFYLPGQEDAAGNIRAFAALEPCHADGGTCETGVDCCGGHCYMGKCQLPPPPPPPPDPPPPPPPGEPPPPPPPPPCSNIDEVCRTVDDCCDKGKPGATCLSHYCAIIAPPH